tara:strand:+ start:90 stop:197 length:108 start_codon:yes stop_codon:yes gene_type:complete
MMFRLKKRFFSNEVSFHQISKNQPPTIASHFNTGA